MGNAAHTVCQPDKNRIYILPLIRSCGVSASEKSANTSKKKIAAAIIIIDSIIRSPSFLSYIADSSGSQGLSPTYEQAHVGERPCDPGIILSDYIIISSVFSVNLFSDILSKDSQVRYCSPRHSQILFYKKCRKAAAGKQEVLCSCILEKRCKVHYLAKNLLQSQFR